MSASAFNVTGPRLTLVFFNFRFVLRDCQILIVSLCDVTSSSKTINYLPDVIFIFHKFSPFNHPSTALFFAEDIRYLDCSKRCIKVYQVKSQFVFNKRYRDQPIVVSTVPFVSHSAGSFITFGSTWTYDEDDDDEDEDDDFFVHDLYPLSHDFYFAGVLGQSTFALLV